MFGLGFMEILVLAVIAFLVFGPRRFPELVKNFIKTLNELKASFTELKSELDEVKTSAETHIQQISHEVEKDLNWVKSIPSSLKKEAGLSNLEENSSKKQGSSSEENSLKAKPENKK